MTTPLGNAIEFLKAFGFYDVVLPFLFVFALVFAVLEKTKVFGTEKIGEKDVPKKNVNSMVAFVIALFVVATPKIVDAIQLSMPNVAFILIIIFSFLMLLGVFFSGEKEFSFDKDSKVVWFFGFLIFIGLLGVFLDAFGELDTVLDYIYYHYADTLVVTIMFLAIIAGTIYYVSQSVKTSSGD